MVEPVTKSLPDNQNVQRKLAHIEKVSKIDPIVFINKEGKEETAESIVLVHILGWKVVAKKSEFKEGDFCIYFEIDSILPEHPEFAFLASVHYRIKTIKLKGQISQGLLSPVTILKSFTDKPIELTEGLDVTDIIGVKKYDPENEAEVAMTKSAKASSFPTFFKKTDEERIQNLKWLLEEFRDETFYIAEKLDGSSISFFYNELKFGVCSRNMEVTDPESDFYKAAVNLDIENKLKAIGKNLVLQGELIGGKIQGNKYKQTEMSVRFFNVYDIDRMEYYDLADFEKFIKELGYKTVPILDRAFKLPATVDELLLMAEGPSALNPKQTREGFVIRPLREKSHPRMRRLSFKVISNKFLLKHEA
mmetsp:Transcript_37998/g.44289  ORF Transcript_37998/g.44289 Transcript_37998/m.44289 type:complete len:362 (-) Transcript_37998:95-1180(-)